MTSYKFQIANAKLQINPKTQIRNISKISVNQIDSIVSDMLHSA
jgi:hypothetical protein